MAEKKFNGQLLEDYLKTCYATNFQYMSFMIKRNSKVTKVDTQKKGKKSIEEVKVSKPVKKPPQGEEEVKKPNPETKSK